MGGAEGGLKSWVGFGGDVRGWEDVQWFGGVEILQKFGHAGELADRLIEFLGAFGEEAVDHLGFGHGGCNFPRIDPYLSVLFREFVFFDEVDNVL